MKAVWEVVRSLDSLLIRERRLEVISVECKIEDLWGLKRQAFQTRWLCEHTQHWDLLPHLHFHTPAPSTYKYLAQHYNRHRPTLRHIAVKFWIPGDKADIQQVSSEKVQTKEDSYWPGTSKQQQRTRRKKKLCLNILKKNTSNLEFTLTQTIVTKCEDRKKDISIWKGSKNYLPHTLP